LLVGGDEVQRVAFVALDDLAPSVTTSVARPVARSQVRAGRPMKE
jgi:hypothetical protein